MNIGLIGEIVENTMVIKHYVDEHQHNILCSGFIDNVGIIEQFVSANNSCDVIIIDLTNLICVSDSDFRTNFVVNTQVRLYVLSHLKTVINLPRLQHNVVLNFL